MVVLRLMVGCIGLDDAIFGRDDGLMGQERVDEVAERFAALFAETYLAFHRRIGPRSVLSGPARSVLLHLAATGPVTIGEATQHLARSQSVVSEIITRLERRGLLEREADPTDRRRTLVWLTPAGADVVREEQQVLDIPRLRSAVAELPPGSASALLNGLTQLLATLHTPTKKEVTR